MLPSIVVSIAESARDSPVVESLLSRQDRLLATVFLLIISLLFLFQCRRRRKNRIAATRLDDKVILITGAGSGIGQLLAVRLVERCSGLKGLILWDINETGLKKTMQLIRNSTGKERQIVEKIDNHLHNQDRDIGADDHAPGKAEQPSTTSQLDVDQNNNKLFATTQLVDVSNRAQVFQAAENLVEKNKSYPLVPDLLILNAGVVKGNEFVEFKSEQNIRQLFDVNVFHLFWCVQAFLPKMMQKRHWNRIVTVASASGSVGVPRLTDYCASKFAAQGFHESLTAELLFRKRRSNDLIHTDTVVVNPSLTSTSMFHGAVATNNFLLPSLTPEYLVGKIIEESIFGDTEDLRIPFMVKCGPVLKLMLPTKWSQFIVEKIGGNYDNFATSGTRTTPSELGEMKNEQNVVKAAKKMN
ncbi:unnamed protein product [Amoebophrya sp. A120]|nr:unnamed protein product [Amoebophrya sp. A120]|eukprot:GSA120T00000688001.1